MGIMHLINSIIMAGLAVCTFWFGHMYQVTMDTTWFWWQLIVGGAANGFALGWVLTTIGNASRW